jgi:TrmH family RNA methyltransferase
VREALSAGGLIELFYEPDRQDDLVEAARAAGATVTEVTPQVLAAMADTVTPQGLVGVAPLVDVPLESLAAVRLVVVLDAVNDPGNAGTVIRTADAAGADAVVLTAGSVDPHNPKCVRATAGSLWHLPVVSGADLTTVVARLQAEGVRVLATSGAGSTDLDVLVDDGGLSGPTAWLLGPEAAGLSEEALELADLVVRIPLRGRAESLNLSAAAAVCLYASARAHRESSPQRPRQP